MTTAPPGSIIWTLERGLHNGTQRCCARVLKIVTPIETVQSYTGFIPKPVEGDLLRKASGNIWYSESEDLCTLPDVKHD
jgi:hypothetical protein